MATSLRSEATCAFKDLCIDVTDPGRQALFWAVALGLRAEPIHDSYRLVDDVPEHTVWLNRVPEPKSVKQRVHLDIDAASIDELVTLGASVLDRSQPWTVLADPEGGEFCAFVREPDELGRYRFYELSVDSAEPATIAGWWAAQLGVAAHAEEEEGFSWLDGVPGMPGEVVFAPVPEPKLVKNRIHWDVWGDTARLVAAGATLLRASDDERAWDVLADPEGNEFCVFPVPPDQG